MLSTDIPAKFLIPFANNAGVSFKRAVPQASQIGVNAGYASLIDGFPPICFLPIASGGVPPQGEDFNGILNQITAWIRWFAAGPVARYDAAFSTAIGGYPIGALLAGTTPGVYWYATADNVTTNPDVNSTGWAAFGLPPFATLAEVTAGTVPGKAVSPLTHAQTVQSGAYCYGPDTGALNALVVALIPTPTALVVGQLVTTVVAVSSTGAATLNLNGLGAAAIQFGGLALRAGALVAGRAYTFAWDGSRWDMQTAPSGGAVLGDTGYEIRPSGVIECWGSGPGFSGEGQGSFISFPVPGGFPNACRNIVFGVTNPSVSNYRDSTVQWVNKSTTGFTPYYQNNGGAGANCDGFNWRALGD